LGKVKIAVRLREETLVTMAWIAERLQMGSVAHVNTPCACEVAIVLTKKARARAVHFKFGVCIRVRG